MILALNLNAAMRHLVLDGQWVGRRIKALRFHLIRMPGRVVLHAQKLRVKITAGPIAPALHRGPKHHRAASVSRDRTAADGLSQLDPTRPYTPPHSCYRPATPQLRLQRRASAPVMAGRDLLLGLTSPSQPENCR